MGTKLWQYSRKFSKGPLLIKPSQKSEITLIPCQLFWGKIHSGHTLLHVIKLPVLNILIEFYVSMHTSCIQFCLQVNIIIHVYTTYDIVYYIVITIVEHDIRKYHEFIAEYCYECEARVTIRR